jgi:RimJ/RimL family protein N-acetyltransferase
VKREDGGLPGLLGEGIVIETPRLTLRPWVEDDVPEFVRVTNTPTVMEYLGGVLAPERFATYLARSQSSQADHGFCFWIAERRSDLALLGFCGLKIATVGPINGEIEIGWRLREDAWGQGYAREGAMASLDWAWRNLSCKQIVAITVNRNSRSRGLMERLGMNYVPDLDFDYPDFSLGHPCRPHVTYTIARPPTV